MSKKNCGQDFAFHFQTADGANAAPNVIVAPPGFFADLRPANGLNTPDTLEIALLTQYFLSGKYLLTAAINMCKMHINFQQTEFKLETIPTMNTTPPEIDSDSPGQDKVLGTISRLLLPLAHLCLKNGVAIAAVEELLKQSFVQEANALQPGTPEHGKVSRISIATGLTRREVTRLIKSGVSARSPKPSLATEIFARWTTNSTYQDHGAAPAVLKRQGPEPSFEALAQSITHDVHPRSVLDELVRLGLTTYDKENDTVALTRTEYVPGRDAQQMLDLLGDNVGDHLAAAVANVSRDDSRHLEQAVFADELSAESLKSLRPLFAAQWTALRNAMVPVITDLIESDKRAGRIQDKRMRIGLYTFDESMTDTAASPNEAEKTTRRKYYYKESKK